MRWHLSITRVQISEDSVRYPTSTSLHKLCYLRYKVYDRSEGSARTHTHTHHTCCTGIDTCLLLITGRANCDSSPQNSWRVGWGGSVPLQPLCSNTPPSHRVTEMVCVGQEKCCQYCGFLLRLSVCVCLVLVQVPQGGVSRAAGVAVREGGASPLPPLC